MSGKTNVRYGAIAVIAMSVVVIVGAIWFVLRDIRTSKAHIEESRLRYLKAQSV